MSPQGDAHNDLDELKILLYNAYNQAKLATCPQCQSHTDHERICPKDYKPCHTYERVEDCCAFRSTYEQMKLATCNQT